MLFSWSPKLNLPHTNPKQFLTILQLIFLPNQINQSKEYKPHSRRAFSFFLGKFFSGFRWGERRVRIAERVASEQHLQAGWKAGNFVFISPVNFCHHRDHFSQSVATGRRYGPESFLVAIVAQLLQLSCRKVHRGKIILIYKVGKSEIWAWKAIF